MRVMIISEAQFVRTPDGNVYAQGQPVHYEFLSRYLKIFDEVVVLARVKDIVGHDYDKLGLHQANGPDVHFFDVPYYVGPWQYLKKHFQVTAAVKRAVDEADAYILRGMGQIGHLLLRSLKRNGIPYGLEVLTDPWDMFSPGTRKGFLRPVLRIIGTLRLARECRLAPASSYVTREALQRRYPPGGWTTHHSSIDLTSEIILDDSVVETRMRRIEEKIHTGARLCLCFVGNMGQLFKGQDILIESTFTCIQTGINLRLTMIGDGQYVARLRDQARMLGIADYVKFLGRLKAGSEVFAQLDKADLFVLPSRQEGLPRAMIEAMARGMPCIGSSVGGIPELLADEDIVPPADVKALADKMEEVLRDVSRLERMARRNLQTAREYRRSELSKRWVEFHRKVKELTEKYQKGQTK